MLNNQKWSAAGIPETVIPRLDFAKVQYARWRHLVRDGLLRAAELIEQCGHTKMEFVSNKGALCTFGAMLAAFGYEPNNPATPRAKGDRYFMKAEQLVDEAIGQVGICYWNNAHYRTASEVTGMLRAAASLA